MIWRSPADLSRRLGWRAFLWAGLGALIAVPGLAWLVLTALRAQAMVTATLPPLGVQVALLALIMAPLLSWVGLPVCLLIGRWLLARGWGGWGSFAVLGACIGYGLPFAVDWVFEPEISRLGAWAGAVHSLVAWWILRWRAKKID